ncbi:unnamed protein product [Moneuplotes crassus]|uniref:Uncharacterized protein n=1 Tax=Euplotes crassus TaxID=5936 RepID=A0AAD1U744_EUPCR|nr:unnamed protein product [Moneuplotes crassus]
MEYWDDCGLNVTGKAKVWRRELSKAKNIRKPKLRNSARKPKLSSPSSTQDDEETGDYLFYPTQNHPVPSYQDFEYKDPLKKSITKQVCKLIPPRMNYKIRKTLSHGYFT